jgi:Mannose-6-phosphate isomerase
MDALSKIFDDIHLHRSEYIYLRSKHPWAFHFQDHNAMVAYVVIQGQCVVHIDQEQVLLEAGDLCLIPSGQNHHCKSIQSDVLVESVNITPLFQEQRNKTIELNSAESHEAEELFVLAIRGHVDSIMAKPLVNALPTLLHTPHIMSSTAPEWLQIGLHFLAVEAHQIRPGRDKILDHLVSILFIECVRDYIAALSDSSSWLHALVILNYPTLWPRFMNNHSMLGPSKVWQNNVACHVLNLPVYSLKCSVNHHSPICSNIVCDWQHSTYKWGN